MSSNRKPIRWGIIGLGHIAHKFAEGLSFVKNAKLVGVASSSLSRARMFSSRHKVPMVFNSYAALAAAAHIDVVYIASYNHRHFEHMQLCLEHGKHVLCEKPLTTRADDSRNAFQLARSKKRLLMEALWTRFLPSIAFLDQLMAEKRYGAVRHIQASFGFKAPNKPHGRLLNKDLGGGALLDIGIYPLFLCQHLLGPAQTSAAEITFGPTGVDLSSEVSLTYPGASADIACSFTEELPNEARIRFENATLVLQSRWHGPTQVILISDKTEQIRLTWQGNGYNYEAQFTTDLLLSGKSEQTMMPAALTISLAEQIESLLADSKRHS